MRECDRPPPPSSGVESLHSGARDRTIPNGSFARGNVKGKRSDLRGEELSAGEQGIDASRVPGPRTVVRATVVAAPPGERESPEILRLVTRWRRPCLAALLVGGTSGSWTSVRSSPTQWAMRLLRVCRRAARLLSRPGRWRAAGIEAGGRHGTCDGISRRDGDGCGRGRGEAMEAVNERLYGRIGGRLLA
jgi:hypothetical protein